MKNISKAVFTFVLLVGCAPESTPVPKTNFLYYDIHSSQYNEYAAETPKTTKVIDNITDYENELYLRSSDQITEVDFSKNSILLVDMGWQKSGGYNVGIQEVVESEESVQVNILYTFPKTSCSNTTAITNPYVFTVVSSKKYILLSEKIKFTDC